MTDKQAYQKQWAAKNKEHLKEYQRKRRNEARKRNNATAPLINPRKRELEWYRKFGKYRDRIVRDADGKEYVIGDWAWARFHPNAPEEIEPSMREYRET